MRRPNTLEAIDARNAAGKKAICAEPARIVMTMTVPTAPPMVRMMLLIELATPVSLPATKMTSGPGIAAQATAIAARGDARDRRQNELDAVVVEQRLRGHGGNPKDGRRRFSDALVADGRAGGRLIDSAIGPQVRTADAGPDDPHDRIRGLLDLWVWGLFEADAAGMDAEARGGPR